MVLYHISKTPRLESVEHEDQQVVPLSTSTEALARWSPETPYLCFVKLKEADLCWQSWAQTTRHCGPEKLHVNVSSKVVAHAVYDLRESSAWEALSEDEFAKTLRCTLEYTTADILNSASECLAEFGAERFCTLFSIEQWEVENALTYLRPKAVRALVTAGMADHSALLCAFDEMMVRHGGHYNFEYRTKGRRPTLLDLYTCAEQIETKEERNSYARLQARAGRDWKKFLLSGERLTVPADQVERIYDSYPRALFWELVTDDHQEIKTDLSGYFIRGLAARDPFVMSNIASWSTGHVNIDADRLVSAWVAISDPEDRSFSDEQLATAQAYDYENMRPEDDLYSLCERGLSFAVKHYLNEHDLTQREIDTATQPASNGGFTRIVALLGEYGANLRFFGDYPIKRANQEGFSILKNYLLNQGVPSRKFGDFFADKDTEKPAPRASYCRFHPVDLKGKFKRIFPHLF